MEKTLGIDKPQSKCLKSNTTAHLARHANNADARVAPSLTSYCPKTSLLAPIITIQSEILNIRGNASSMGYSTS